MYETLNLWVSFIFYLIIFNYSTNSTICGVFLVKIHNFYIYGSSSYYFVNMLPCHDLDDRLIRLTHSFLFKLSDIAEFIFYTFFYESVSAIELLSYLLLPVPSHYIRLILNLWHNLRGCIFPDFLPCIICCHKHPKDKETDKHPCKETASAIFFWRMFSI